MKNRELYQTVEDRNNPDYIESHGPFKCTRSDAWLGPGYYFWDSFIDVAHWWGRKSYQNKGSGYVICHSSCSDTLKQVYDTVGRPELLSNLYDVGNVIKQQRDVANVYVPEILEYIKRKTDFLNHYKAIRLFTLNTKNTDTSLKFTKGYKAYIDIYPPIQFCFFDKSLFTSDYTIIYPDEYINNGVM